MLTGCAILLLGGIFIFSCWKAPYGAASSDERFYFTLAQRYWLGDAPIAHEWHPATLFGVFLSPLYALFRLFSTTNEGVFLVFRYVYVVFQLCISTAAYFRLRRFGWSALAVTGMYFLLTPFGLMTLSYNAVGLGFVFLLCVTLFGAAQKRPSTLFGCGILAALAVLCCPYFILVLAVGVVGVVAWGVYCRVRKPQALPANLFRLVLFFCSGGLLLAAAVLLFIFSRCSPNAFFQAFPELFMDVEHPSQPAWQTVKEYFWWHWAAYRALWYVTLPAFFLGLFVCGRPWLTWLVFCAEGFIAWCTLLNYAYYSTRDLGHTSIMLPLFCVSAVAWALLRDKRSTLWCTGWFLCGVAYSFCMHFASNTALHVINMGLAVSTCAGVFFIRALLQEQGVSFRVRSWNIPRVALLGCVSILCATQLFSQVYVRVNHTYAQPSLSQIDTVIQTGTMRGLRTDAQAAQMSEHEEALVRGFAQQSDEAPVLLLSHTIRNYLVFDRPYGTYSAWMNVADFRSRLQRYYAIFPEKLPRLILVDLDYVDTFTAANVTAEALNHGYQLLGQEENYMCFIQSLRVANAARE